MEMTKIQQDIATIVARLEQLEHELDMSKRIEGLALSIWERVISCDVPRLKEYVYSI